MQASLNPPCGHFKHEYVRNPFNIAVTSRTRKPRVHIDDTKECSQCKEWLPLSRFGRNKRRWDGLQIYCKECGKNHSNKGTGRKPGLPRQPDIAPTATKEEIAWAAGIFEGEGTFARVRSGYMIKVPQKDPWILQRLENIFGGSVHARKDGMYEWIICGGKCRGLASAIEKYLSPRRLAQLEKGRERLKDSENKKAGETNDLN